MKSSISITVSGGLAFLLQALGAVVGGAFGLILANGLSVSTTLSGLVASCLLAAILRNLSSQKPSPLMRAHRTTRCV